VRGPVGGLGICFVCSEYPPGPSGGIGVATRFLAQALARKGHRVRVIGTYDHCSPAPSQEDDAAVRVWRLPIPKHRFGWVLARCQLFRIVSQWARAGEIDLVEVPDWEGPAAGWPRLPVPVVARLHGSAAYFAAELGQPIPRTGYWLERASLRRADARCSVSDYTAAKTEALFRLRHTEHVTLYNSVDPGPPETPNSRSRARVVFTGTLTPRKGVISLIRAWPRVAAVDPEAELHIYGKDTRRDDGSSVEAALRALVARRVRKTVWFHGHVPHSQVIAALRTAAVGVFPSYAEAFALAPLEAMALGCATVYARRGSGPELIRDGVDGLLVDPDSPAEIAAAISQLLCDPARAARLAAAGQERVRKNFSAKSLVPRNEAFYRNCLWRFHERARR